MTQPRTITAIEALEAPPINDEGNSNLLHYWRTIRRHKWGIFSVTLIAVIIGTLSALATTPIYQAKTVIMANPIQPDINSENTSTALVFLFYQTQFEIIKSRTVAERVVDKLSLVEKYKYDRDLKANRETETADNLYQRIRSLISMVLDWRSWLPEELLPELPPEPDNTTIRHQQIKEIQENLTVRGGKKSEIITISYESPDPQLAADIANAIADSYIEFGLNSRLSGAKKTATWLNEQLTELKNNLKESESALEAYQQAKGLVNSSQQQEIASTQLSSLNTELISAQSKRSEAEILYNQVKALTDSEGNYETLGPVLNSPAVRSLVQEEAKFTREVKEKSERYGEKHPKMIAARSDLKEVQRSLQREIDKVVDSISKKYKVALAHEKKIASLINQQKREIRNLKGVNFELARLERDVENNRSIYENFFSKFQEADMSEDYDASNVRIIDSAIVPRNPDKPKILKISLFSGLFGIILGLVLAFLRESLDTTLKTTDTIEEKLAIPSLGLIPLVKRGLRSEIPENQYLSDPRSQFSENINNIRTGLLFSNIERPPQIILVTSATESEGKSSFSINLSASLSQLDRTLLLELDLRKPSISQALKISPTPGLSDLVSNQSDLSQVPVPRIGDENSNFFVITAGTLPPNPLELISSLKFHQVISKFRSNFKYIVLDAPPILAVSDAAVLGQLSDSVIMVIKAESTTVKMSREAMDRLKKSNVNITGAVLSQAVPHRMSYYGAHYYHSNYYGYTTPKTEEAA